ncbi:PTPRD [Acanthosepion pharaonis]|uniref:PTPRD n=1 Tax=Acanthosepion pharaonis TaxID=158019 RepID=A0A812DEG8_ACAPH|nr:PTPRD [Sepia pharaonis]
MVYIYRILAIKKYSVREKRFVHHFQCTIWPDHGILEEPASFIEFRNKVQFSPSSKPPFVVHCSAGDGRTGTYIALDILLEQLWKKPTIDIFSCVNQLCQQRAFMVQNKIQYQFIHDVLAEEILTGFSEIFVTSIPEEFKKLKTSKANGEKAMLKKQYEEFIFPLNQFHPTESYQEPIFTNVEINNVSSTKQNALEPVYVVQFQSKIWQRKQLPFPSDLIELIQTVTNSCGLRKQLLIHCKDGITKSSIFCVLCVMICKIRMNETVSILRLLRTMKKKNPQIVTDYESYKFCWSVAEILQDENSTYYSYCHSQEISEIV